MLTEYAGLLLLFDYFRVAAFLLLLQANVLYLARAATLADTNAIHLVLIVAALSAHIVLMQLAIKVVLLALNCLLITLVAVYY